MKKVYVFLANGFEEIEALTVVDMLRRAKIETVTVSVEKSKTVVGSHEIPVIADVKFSETDFSDGSMAVLPGGLAGTNGLKAHKGLAGLLLEYNAKKKMIAAICAAPSVLGGLGILRERHATCYPGFENQLTGAVALKDAVVRDGNIITSRGMGTAIDFSAAIIEVLADEETATELLGKIMYLGRRTIYY